MKNRKKLLVHFIICLIAALLVCMPLANGSIAMGSDTSFHIDRIEALYQAMEAGQLYPKIFWNQNFGWGYGSPLFYSDFFLIIPAWFRHLGMGILPSYRLFLFLLFFCMACTMCHLASDVIHKDYLSTASAVLIYVFSSYLFSTIYNRGAIGEAQAAVFVPLVLHAMWGIFWKNCTKADAAELMLGFSGLLLCHNITFFLTEMWFVIYCIVHWKMILKRKKRLYAILFAEAGAFLLTAWFSLPMLEQLDSGKYRISTYFNDPEALGESGVDLKGVFDFFQYNHDLVGGANGLGETVLPLLYFTLPKNRRSGFIRDMTISGYILLWMTTRYFPWKLFPFMSFLQFPHRLFIVNSSMLAAAAGYVFAYLPVRKQVHQEAKLSIAGVLLVTMFLQINSQYNYGGVYTDDTEESVFHDATVYFPTVDNWYNVAEISSPDYLPADTAVVYNSPRIIVHGIMKDSVFDEDSSSMSWHYDGGGEYLFPKTWYKGMKVNVLDQGNIIAAADTAMDPTTGGCLFSLPDGLPETASIVLYYEGTGLQKLSRMASIASAVTMTCMAFMMYLQKRIKRR